MTTKENEEMTTRCTTRTRDPHLHLLMLVFMIIGSVAPIVLFGGATVAAQPLCLDGKVWSEEAQACVDPLEAQPVEELPVQEPQPSEPPAPSETPVPTEAPAPTDASAATEAAAPTDVSAETGTPSGDSDLRTGGPPAALYVTSFKCPATFDPHSADQAARRSTCPLIEQEIVYSLTIDGVVNSAQVVASNMGGARWGTVPAVDFAVSQSVPPGYTGPATIFCQQGAAPNASGTTFTFTHDGGSFLLQVRPGETWYCSSFLVAQPQSEITVYVNGCPEGYDIYTKGPDELKAECTGDFEGLEFVLVHPADGVSHAITNQFSMLTFENVPAGQVRLQEYMPNGYGVPVVFCQVSGPSGQTFEQYDKVNVANNASIGLGMDELEFAGCDFFQAPGGQPVVDDGYRDPGFPVQGSGGQFARSDDPSGTPASGQPFGTPDADQAVLPAASPVAAGKPGVPDVAAVEDINEIEPPDDRPGTVTVLTHECPASFDAYNATARDINLFCPYPERAVFEFSLVDGAGALSLRHTAMKEPYVEFTAVAPGPISLMEAAPGGFQESVVYCQVVGEPGQEPTPYERVAVSSSNAIQHSLGGADRLACDWFNVPAISPFDGVEGVEPQELLPVEPIVDDSGEDAPSATPGAAPRR